MHGLTSTWEEAALRFFSNKNILQIFFNSDEQQMLLSLTPPSVVFVVHLQRQPGLATCLVMASSEAQKVSTS